VKAYHTIQERFPLIFGCPKNWHIHCKTMFTCWVSLFCNGFILGPSAQATLLWWMMNNRHGFSLSVLWLQNFHNFFVNKMTGKTMKSSKESSYNNLLFKILNVIRNYAYGMHQKKPHISMLVLTSRIFLMD